MFLLKTFLCLSFVILLLPVGIATNTAGRGETSRLEMLSAAKAVWHDFSAFCERNQETCETGNQLIARFGDKARNGARMLHEYLDEDFGQTRADDVVTGSVTR
jgi:hypothetical protein